MSWTADNLPHGDQALPPALPAESESPIMSPRVTAVRHLGDFRLEITFSDDVSGVLDFWPRIMNRHGVFEPFHDLEFFRQVRVDSESGTPVGTTTSISASINTIAMCCNLTLPASWSMLRDFTSSHAEHNDLNSCNCSFNL